MLYGYTNKQKIHLFENWKVFAKLLPKDKFTLRNNYIVLAKRNKLV